jgi:hypothetical protein
LWGGDWEVVEGGGEVIRVILSWEFLMVLKVLRSSQGSPGFLGVLGVLRVLRGS